MEDHPWYVYAASGVLFVALQCGVLGRYSQEGLDNHSISATVFPGKNSSSVNGPSTQVC